MADQMKFQAIDKAPTNKCCGFLSDYSLLRTDQAFGFRLVQPAGENEGFVPGE